MKITLMEPVELRERGFEVLVQSLGWVNAVRFLQQFERSKLNYTAERDAIQSEWSVDQLLSKLRDLDSK
jgi:hypothetical protein